jgi:hypothetical protein
VVCGAPLAARAGEAAERLEQRWSVSVVVTDPAGQWFDRPSERDRPRPDVVVACPLTFNTANKVAEGIMDTSAARALCDAIGVGVPLVGVPMVNNRLWGTRFGRPPCGRSAGRVSLRRPADRPDRRPGASPVGNPPGRRRRVRPGMGRCRCRANPTAPSE